MIFWLISAPFSIIISILCLITNPIVVLFCNEDGELPSFLALWQTWDNSCNPSDVYDNKELPVFLLYDWPRHYREWKGATPELFQQGRERWYTTCIDPNFSLWERVQRYICRVYWLTRNCAYGWGFWIFGVIPGIQWWEFTSDNGQTRWVHEPDALWWISGAWMYKSTAPICKIGNYVVRREIFLGWKVKPEALVDTRGMIATRATIRIKREG